MAAAGPPRGAPAAAGLPRGAPAAAGPPRGAPAASPDPNRGTQYANGESSDTSGLRERRGVADDDGNARGSSAAHIVETETNLRDTNESGQNGSPLHITRKVTLGNTFINFTGPDDPCDDEDKETKEEVLDPEEAFERALEQLGPFGFYQRYVLVLLCLPNMLAVMYSLNYVFVAEQVPFRCIVSECEGVSGGGFHNGTVQQLLAEDACRRYRPLLPQTEPSCERHHYHSTDTIPCDAFLYENYETIYAEFSLACNEWRRTLVGTVRNVALPLALLLTGYVSDGWGRRTAFCIFVGCAGGLGIIKSFSPNYVVYLVMEFLEAALGYGFNSAAYVMVVELARPSLRAAFACATGVAYGLGGIAFAMIARQVRPWRQLLRTVHTPALLLVLYWLLLDESARWLHATGRRRRAQGVVKKAAQWNKVLLDEKLSNAISGESQTEDSQKGNPWGRLVRSRVLLLRLAVCAWCWVAAAFVYYGLTINSVSLAGDKYVNFALSMAMEVVASLLIVMSLERFGRKRSIFVAFLLCGVACVTPFFVSHAGTGLGLFFVGKLAITFAFNSLYVFVAELFPTDARSSALAAASLVGRLGSILAPQTPLLSAYLQALLYGACSASAALLVLLAPETRRAPLPPRVHNAERLRAPPFTPAHSRVHSPVVTPGITPAATPSVTPTDTLSRAHTHRPEYFTRF